MNIGDKMNSVKYNAVINAILSVANIIFPLITFPYVSRVLLVENNGRISFASALLNFFSLFATLGLSTYGIKESITLFAFFVELKEKKQSRWLFQSQICRIWAS